MNLMGMVNGLNRMDDTNPFSATAFLLAVKLIDLFNRLFWADSVAVDLTRMGVMAKCSSRATITRARDELVERGVLVIVRKGKKGTPTTYRMNDISVYCSKIEQYPVLNSIPNPEQYPVPNSIPNPEQYPVHIYRQDYKQDHTRPYGRMDEEDEDADFARACAHARQLSVTAYRQHFGADPTPAEADAMAAMYVNLDLVGVISRSMELTAKAAPTNRLAYLRKICADWRDAYIRSASDLDEHQYLMACVRGQVPGEDAAASAEKLLQAVKSRKERYTG